MPPASLRGSPGEEEGEGVERGSGGVEEEEVASVEPREDRVGVRPRGRERVQVGEGGDRVTVLEDGFGRGEQREEEEEAQGKEEEEVEGRGGHGVGGDGGRRRGCWWAGDGESCSA